MITIEQAISLIESVKKVSNVPELDDVIEYLNDIPRLKKDSDKLARLEVYGVDNWQDYEDAINDTEGLFSD